MVPYCALLAHCPPEKVLIVTFFLITMKCFRLFPGPQVSHSNSFCLIEPNVTTSATSDPFTIHFVSTTSPTLSISNLRLRSLSSWLWLGLKKGGFFLPSDSVGESVSHIMLPVFTMPNCLFLSTRCKFSRRYMISVSEWVRKLLYKQPHVNFLVTFYVCTGVKEIDYSLVSVN